MRRTSASIGTDAGLTELCIDAFTRIRLRDRLLAAWLRYRPTLVLVTHDLDEPVDLADRVIVLGERPGRVARVNPVAPSRPRDRRDPALAALRVELLEAVHLERDATAVVAGLSL